MRTKIGCLAVLAGVMGMAAEAAAMGENYEAAAGKRGLSPIAPAHYAPVMIAQTPQAQDPARTDRTIGVCHLVNSLGVSGRDDPLSPVYVITPLGTVSDYINITEKRYVGLEGKVTLPQGPEHGTFEMGTTGGRYRPNTNFIGSDRATFLVEIGGLKVKAVYHFKVIDGGAIGGTEIDDKKNCPRGMFWKISTTSDNNGNLIVTSVDYQSPMQNSGDTTLTSDSLDSRLSLAQLDGKIADLTGINVTFADLTGAAVGQTVGSTITLDTNAAGHNWYIDSNPWDNSEYLPTFNPFEWVAKEGTDAYGKMDMLSVLLTNTAMH